VCVCVCVQVPAPVHCCNDLFHSIVDALSEIAPAESYLRTDVLLPSGHVIGEDDFILVVSLLIG